MFPILEFGMSILTGLLMIIDAYSTNPKEDEVLKREHKKRYWLKRSAIPIIFIFTIAGLFKAFLDNQDKDREQKERRVERDSLVMQVRFKDATIDSILRITSTSRDDNDKTRRNTDTIKERVRNGKNLTTVVQQQPVAGVPVFQLCSGNRATITPFPENTGIYEVRTNFCVDRDISNVHIIPTVYFNSGSQVINVMKDDQMAWTKPAMSKGDTFRPAGKFFVEPRPDTLFMRLKASYTNNDKERFTITMVYFLVWGTNRWIGALPGQQIKFEELLKQAQR